MACNVQYINQKESDFNELLNIQFEESSKSARYNITQVALCILGALACFASLTTYLWHFSASDAENFNDKHIWDPIDKMFDENKNREVQHLGLDRHSNYIPMQQF